MTKLSINDRISDLTRIAVHGRGLEQLATQLAADIASGKRDTVGERSIEKLLVNAAPLIEALERLGVVVAAPADERCGCDASGCTDCYVAPPTTDCGRCGDPTLDGDIDSNGHCPDCHDIMAALSVSGSTKTPFQLAVDEVSCDASLYIGLMKCFAGGDISHHNETIIEALEDLGLLMPLVGSSTDRPVYKLTSLGRDVAAALDSVQ